MEKDKNTVKIIWYYLKDKKKKLFLYIFLVIFTYLPVLLNAYFWGMALEGLMMEDFSKFVLFLGLWEGLYILFYSLLQIPRDALYNELEIQFTKNVSKDLYQKLDNLPAKAFEDIGVGEWINRIYTDPDRVMELLNKLIKMICRALVVVVVFIIAFRVSFILGIECSIFGLVMGLISYHYFPKIKKTQEKIKKDSDRYVKIATENITGIREIKSLGIKKNVENKVFSIIDRLFLETRKIKKYEIVYYGLNNLAYFILQFIILFTSGYLFMEGKLAYSTFIMLEMYIWRIDDVVESISDFGVNYNKVKVSLKRISEVVHNKLYQDEHFGNKKLKNTKGVITFNHVNFKYSDNEDYTLKDFSLEIEPGGKIAIVGRSGNGKSTLFNLLLRYFDPSEGEILLDGILLNELTEEDLRSNISIIRQSPFLFNLSIFENFQLVREDVTLDEVRKVCREAYIDEYIMSLPNQYNTIIGEGGVNLSGGQKQRIAIARTLLLNTKIILFDEATSALDNESQSYIKKTIDNLVKDHTIVIVAHRLSTIVDAECIHVVDHGTLIASGTHQELLATCMVYQNLYQSDSSILN